MGLLPSPAKSWGFQIVGANFCSKNFQGPKLHITVHFLFAKARKKVIIAPLIWISQLFGGDGSKSTLVFKIFWTLIGILLQKYFQPIVRNANAKLMQTGNIVINRSVHFMLIQFFKYYACYCSEFSKGLVNLISCATSHCH